MRRTLIAVWTTVALLSVLSVTAHATPCTFGCSRAHAACRVNEKLTTLGCQKLCDETYEADPGAPDANQIYSQCQQDCKLGYLTLKAECIEDKAECRLACEGVEPITCSAPCGTALHVCVTPIISGGNACVSSCADSACLSSCGAQGTSDLDDCYDDPSTGFAVCLSAQCLAVCGNGAVEPSEQCDDSNLTAGDGCSGSCDFEDTDGDGIYDDGNHNGIVGDAPCLGGATIGCDDNCITVGNSGQADADSDGVGDPCDNNCTGGSGGSDLGGGVYLNSVAPPNAMPGVAVAACRATCCAYATTDGNGLYQFEHLEDGSYNVTAFSSGLQLPGALPAPVVLVAPQVVGGADIVLVAPGAPPPGVTLTNVYSSGGIPVLSPYASNTLTIAACTGGTVTWAATNIYGLNVGGSMTETPAASGNFEVVIPGGTLTGGPLSFTITISGCPNPLDDGTANFNAYIDPSGYTRYHDGSPAIGATVTLMHSDSPVGPFSVVPNGSAIMSPQNRQNPDVSDATGHFGWDVLAGYYKVVATIDGCEVETETLTIPPPVTDLDMRFECPCVGGPLPDCVTAGKGVLTIKNSAISDSKDSLTWKWTKGQATSQLDFGTPLTSTAYNVCVFDGDEDTLMNLAVPAVTRWSATGMNGTDGWLYNDKARSSSGVLRVQLVASDEDKAKIAVKAKGENLPDASLGSLPSPIVVQLQPSEGSLCFESTFAGDEIRGNTTEALKAKTP